MHYYYNGRYKLLRVTPETTEQLIYLVNLSLTPDSVGWPAGNKVLDFWRDPTRLHESVDIFTEDGPLLDSQLRSRDMNPIILMDDVQR